MSWRGAIRLCIAIVCLHSCIVFSAVGDEYHQEVNKEILWNWNALKSVMTTSELKEANDVQLKYLTSELDPVAVRATDSRQIQLSFGAYILVSEACLMSEYVRNLPDGVADKPKLLSGYSSYLAEARSFGEFFLDAMSYLAAATGRHKEFFSDIEEKVNSGIEFSACKSGVLSFFLAHEFAHIKNNDPLKMKDLAADEVNKLERSADLAAYDLMSRSKNFPVVGNFLFFFAFNRLMHEPADSDFYSFDHPLPFDRIIDGLGFTIDYWSKSRAEFGARLPGFDIDVVIDNFKKLKSFIESAKKVQEKYHATSGVDYGLVSFAMNDATYAVRVPRLYLVGGHGITANAIEARVLYSAVLKKISVYFYYELAEANFGAGEAWSSGPLQDFDRACAYFKVAHEMHYARATKKWNDLTKESKCL